MAKKHIKIWGRKALSMLLTLTMVTGMLQIPAMAASYEDQTMEGYYFIDEHGNHGLAPAGVDSVTEDGDNTIVIKYVRKEASYKVIHVYMENTVEQGRTSEVFAGLHGQEIDADSIDHITRYDEKNYRFHTVSEDITLDAEQQKTIMLVYVRGTKPVDPTPAPEDPDEPPVIDIPEEDVPLAPAPTGGEGLEELPDEDVPLANVPKTGDESFKFVLMALASALGLAGLAVTGKRKEDEA